jgi:hypothetical protein
LLIPPAGAQAPELERSYWLHASLGLFTQKGYWGPDYPASQAPSRAEIANAARLLVSEYAANRLYLVYHGEIPGDEARRVFLDWRQAVPAEVEIVPALVLRMYDRDQTPAFNGEDVRGLAEFFRTRINRHRIAVYDVYPNRDQGDALGVLRELFPEGITRLGQQPDEQVRPPFRRLVQDTWSAFCHGKRNEEDWAQPGFGAEALRRWVEARNAGTTPVVWNLIAVAWDYRPTERGGYPGYDDAEKNMPLPAGRNRLGFQLINSRARAEVLGGFSSDLYILHENSRSAAHDGTQNAFYVSLKSGQVYRGYYAEPLREIAGIYRELAKRAD